MTMKKTYLPLIAAGVMAVACSQPETDMDKLSRLQKERDSLITLKDDINASLLVLDEEIAEIDTNKRLTLVTSIPVEKGTFDHFFSVLAEVKADQNVLIYPEAQGIIESIPVREGQQVKKGDLLVSIDAEILASNIQELKGQLDLAKTIYDKRDKLWQQNIGSEVEYLQAKNNYESLQARLNALTAQYEMSQVTAPFDGFVDQIPAKVGEMASPGMPLLRLISLNQVYLKGDVSERYLKQVKEGTYADVYFESIDMRVSSKISQVSNFIKPENRTFMVRIDLKNTDNILKPNLLAEVLIRDYQSKDAITLPNRVIQQSSDGRSFVYLYNKIDSHKGKIQRQYIETGMSYDGRTEVLVGLKGGENVIDKGARSVKEGQRVEKSA